MYDLPYHKEDDEGVIAAFVRDHPLAFLTGCDTQGQPVATQVPVFMDNEGDRIVLSGHLMRGTDHHRAFLSNEKVLAVFTGANVYVSGSWYSEPHTPSTWNYMSVHARGLIRFLDGQALEQALQRLSLHFEDLDSGSPTTYNNLPTELTTKLVKQIVAFEIEVTNLDTVFKLSQDRDVQSYRNIMEKLRHRGENGAMIAHEMQNRMADLFGTNEHPAQE